MVSIKDSDFKKLCDFLVKKYGINLSQKKHLVEGRLNKVLISKGISSYEEYLEIAYQNPNELKELLNNLTTNHTYFMREPEHFEYIRNTVLPILERKIGDKDIRIWSAACSTGEEPYTLAMLIAEYFEHRKTGWDTKILATDISHKALETAKKGIYNVEDIEKLPKLWQKKYFRKIDENRVEIVHDIKKEVIFAPFNLMEENLPFRKEFHLILCRNVMIYFEKDTKIKLINRFYNHTVQGGYLIIGLSETIDKTTAKYNFVKPSIYRKEMIL